MGWSARGQQGEVRYGYQLAASLGRWAMNEDRVDCDDVSYRNDMWLENGVLTLSLNMGNKVLVWRTVEMVSLSPLAFRVIGTPEVENA